MNWLTILVIFLIAHIIADFGMRKEFIKCDNRVPSQPLWKHLVIFVVLFLVLSIAFRVAHDVSLIIVILVVITHTLIDTASAGKGLWQPEVRQKQRSLFISQQALKVLTYVLLSAAWANELSSNIYVGINGVSSRAFNGTPIALGYIFAYVFALFVGDAVVSYVQTMINCPEEQDNTSQKGTGRLIGVFEAVLITTLVITGQYIAVGIYFAIKMLLWYGWLKDDKAKIERFFIGTLANLTCSILGGTLALWIAVSPVFKM